MNHHPCIFQIFNGGTNLCNHPKDVVYAFNWWEKNIMAFLPEHTGLGTQSRGESGPFTLTPN